MKKREALGTVCRNVNWCSHCGTVWNFLKKLRIEPPRDPTILLLGIYPKEKQVIEEISVFHAHCSVVHNSPDMETIQMCIYK